MTGCVADFCSCSRLVIAGAVVRMLSRELALTIHLFIDRDQRYFLKEDISICGNFSLMKLAC